jgi:hypothetical protein
MKKTIIIYFVILLFLSCKPISDTKDGNKCVENTEFKEKFFYHIEYIENNISAFQDSKFKESVIFLSNYAPVSTNHIMNYARTYPIGIFEKDHIKILEWYEENKCNNIKLKSSYIVPEAYKDYVN